VVTGSLELKKRSGAVMIDREIGQAISLALASLNAAAINLARRDIDAVEDDVLAARLVLATASVKVSVADAIPLARDPAKA